jgi:hypothetical protein
VYPEGVARTGEPLFTQLVNYVNLRFHYSFTTKARHSLGGKGSFQLLLSAADGWHRTLQLGQPTYFKGDQATITGTLDLGSLLTLARNIETTTHVDSGYTLAVVPTVTTGGSIEGVPVHAAFTPTIQFSVNSDEVNLQGVESASRLPVGGGASSAAGPLTPSTSGSTTGEQSTSLVLALGPWHPSVSAARTLALSAIGIILAALLAILALLQPLLALLRPRGGESESIRARYGRMIVPVAHVSPLPGDPVIDVADMESLVTIAEHYDRSILYEAAYDGDAYWVTDESGQFRYKVGAADTVIDEQLGAPAWASVDDAYERSQQTLEFEALAPSWPQQLTAQAIAAEPLPEFLASEAIPGILASEVYADELGLGGIFATPATQAEEESLTSEHAGESHWALPPDASTFVQEGLDIRRTDAEGLDVSGWRRDGLNSAHEQDDPGQADGASTTPAASSAASFAGLEWTTNS